MKFFTSHLEMALSVEEKQRHEIIKRADAALLTKPTHITDSIAVNSAGGKHDYFSQADYSWPNPETPDGLPFVNRDGESYPGAFFEHRKAMRSMRTSAAYFTAAYVFTKDTRYSKAAVQWLKEFFLDQKTMMEPSLLYSQAVLGVCTGRGIGIIDTLHLIDVPVAIDILWESGQMEENTLEGLKEWFSKYLNWICTHQYGIDEMNWSNNHSVCWHVQAACFARFTNNQDMLKMCADHYKNILLPKQMAEDGSFPLEIKRTKPYGYSIFVLDNMISLCYLLSSPEDNLWNFSLPDGRNIKKGLDFLFPYLHDKTAWPYRTDIAHHEDWPIGMSFMLFAAAALGEKKWADLYSDLCKFSDNDEVRRNTAIRVPYLWLS
jgi:hypothetical protein